MWRIVVDTFESDDAYPVVTHIFNGRTKAEVVGYFDAHMQTDSFMRPCVKNSEFKGMYCPTHVRLEHQRNGRWVVIRRFS